VEYPVISAFSPSSVVDRVDPAHGLRKGNVMPQQTLSPGRPPVMTSGLVVTFDPDAPEWDSALSALESSAVFTVGERIEGRWPVALEAEDAAASERWTEWLRQLPGVCGVEIVFVHWDVAEEVIHVDR
jgi:nitrate reductase NapAB chaperone NapD